MYPVVDQAMNLVHPMDCIEGMAGMPPSSVDLVFADLPYGRTQNDWDKLLPMEPLWAALKRVCKPSAVLVFTAMQPFTSFLVCSNPDWFRYEMIWKKNKPRGHLNAKKQPLRTHENVLVFYENQPSYDPQMTHGHKPGNTVNNRIRESTCYGSAPKPCSYGGQTDRYPTSVLEIPVVNNDDPERIHPTQKPVDLPAWFIKTYTKPGDLVLDPVAGSGSTLIAAHRLGRRYVGFESDAKMAEAASRRLERELCRKAV